MEADRVLKGTNSLILFEPSLARLLLLPGSLECRDSRKIFRMSGRMQGMLALATAAASSITVQMPTMVRLP